MIFLHGALYDIASTQLSPLGFAKSMSVTMYKSYNSATYIEADIGTSLSTDDSNERGLYVAKIDTQTPFLCQTGLINKIYLHSSTLLQTQ